MINERHFGSWQQLEEAVRELALKTATEGDSSPSNRLLYRGHGSDCWDLQTTLERRTPPMRKLFEYYRLVAKLQPQIASFVPREWPAVDLVEAEKASTSRDGLNFRRLPSYEYLAYLRHHAFPSPLLDWSRSLYVATFFACRRPTSARVAHLVYQDPAGIGKSDFGGTFGGTARIHKYGHLVAPHARHALQQSEYTMAVRWVDGGWEVVPHAEVTNRGIAGQDSMWKFTMPSSEAPGVLRKLDEYNLNAFSLFQGEDALMETLSQRESA